MGTSGWRRRLRGWRASYEEYARELLAVESAGAMPPEEWPRRWRTREPTSTIPRR